MARKNINTTLDEDLYKDIRILALQKGTNANDLIEEGMKYVIKKYSKQNNEPQQV
ncbi:hypothetical protein KQI42_02670 [Tissierella sp. MSJ-40]|uniref:CopG family transcriptional regulator n=1 Tax=Tissierella simiarum TaxID=2841534 RepID=A0ABS6E274_9FIRM|nr:hypothetical protein [Tissierella simiarum]MBU5436894.1 hypothetical protein [Tissierella simiarum]